MDKYKIRFWCEHGGGCLWAVDANTNEKFDYCISYENLPISINLVNKLEWLDKEYSTYLNWDYPQGPCLWTEDQCNSFIEKANQVFAEISLELINDFIIFNDISNCIY